MNQQKHYSEGNVPRSPAGTVENNPENTEMEAGNDAQLQLQKIEDDRLLADADIVVEGMSEEEKRQILWALRESMPAATSPIPPAADQVAESVVEDSVDGEFLPEDPLEAITTSNANKNVDEFVCDSTTSASPSGKSLLPKKKHADTTSDIQYKESDVYVRHHSQRKEISDGSDADVYVRHHSQKKEISDGSDADVYVKLPSRRKEISDGSDADEFTDLLTHITKSIADKHKEQMKLSSRQKEQGQSRFKDLYNKTTLTKSQQNQNLESSQHSSAKEKMGESEAVPVSSQDLFSEEISDEDADSNTTQPEPDQCEDSSPYSGDISKQISSHSEFVDGDQNVKSKSSSRQVQLECELSDNEEGETGRKQHHSPGMYGQGDNSQTQPPEDFVSEEEDKEVEQEDGTDQHSGTVNAVDHDQVTLGRGSSSQEHSENSQTSNTLALTLHVEDEDEGEEDKSPLKHDNWYSWPPGSPDSQLQRSYRTVSRKRKEPSAPRSFFCPRKDTPAEYTKVILEMFNTYLLRYTRLQRCFKKKLPWGKPVRTGQHQPGSLDWRKRGVQSACFDWDVSDFDLSQPPSKKFSIESNGQGKRVRNFPKTEAVKLAVEKNTTVQAAYNAETQAFDVDDELPDIHFSSEKIASNEKFNSKDYSEKSRSSSPILASKDSPYPDSVEEEDNLHCVQLSSRKRQAETDSQILLVEQEKPKQVCKKLCLKKSVSDTVGFQPIGHKRKQAITSNLDSNVNDVSDSDELLLQQKKKIRIEVSQKGFVHISVGKADNLNLDAVQPLPISAALSSSDLRIPRHLKADCDIKKIHYQPVKQTVQLPTLITASHQSSAGVEQGDDSVSDDASQPQQAKQASEIGPLGDIISAGVKSSQDQQMVSVAEEDSVACPLCNRLFPASVIQVHASDCSWEDEDKKELNTRQSSRHATVYSHTQLKRRPLHDGVNSGALKRHFEKCKQKVGKEEKNNRATDALSSEGTSDGASCSTWLNKYKIPRKGNGQTVRVEEIEDESEDSGQDSDYILTEDDKRQEIEDQKDDGFHKASDLHHNQLKKKQKNRSTNLKDKM